MADYVGKIMLIEHPLMLNQYTLCEVMSQSPKTVRVRYWISRLSCWNDEIIRRNTSSLIHILAHSSENVEADALNLFMERLRSAEAERDRRVSAARRSYHETVKGLRIK